MKPSPALLDHFSCNYQDFITLVREGVINRTVAHVWCQEIWFHIYATHYSKAKAA